ncbi:MAG: hypothetical protein J6X43_06285 [Bacteroidales bacterium]|nr:hypothetical protein [Bacteroidales bacterium]
MNLELVSYSRITNDKVIVNGKEENITRTDSSWLTDIYHSKAISYPKFFKMDNLAKAGFLGTELMLQPLDFDRDTRKKNIAVVCCNSSSSLDDDTAYQKTIQDSDNYYPSPAVFVYTLANIVTGEISIRNKVMGESSFYIMKSFDAKAILSILSGVFSDESIDYCIFGWTEYYKNNCDVLCMYIKRSTLNTLDYNKLQKLYEK